MNKKHLSTILFFTVLMIVFTLQANAKTLLRLNPQKGATYEMTMDMQNKMDQQMMGQQVKIDQHIVMVTTMHVADLLPNGNFLIDYSYKAIRMDINAMGQVTSFDSDKSDNNPALSPLKDILKAKLKIEVTPLGKTVKVEGFEQFAQLMSNPQLAQTLSMLASEESFKANFNNTFNYFPEEMVDKGDTWSIKTKMPTLMNSEIAVDYKVLDISKEDIRLAVNADINMDSPIEQQGMTMNLKLAGNQTGTMALDPSDGMMRGSDLKMKFNMEIKMKNPQSGEDMTIPMVMDATVKINVDKK